MVLINRMRSGILTSERLRPRLTRSPENGGIAADGAQDAAASSQQELLMLAGLVFDDSRELRRSTLPAERPLEPNHRECRGKIEIKPFSSGPMSLGA